MLFDPIYWVILGVGLVLSLGAQAWVKAAVSKWESVPMSRGMTGRQVAEAILRSEGISGVTIEQTQGRLSDHYDPRTRTLRLSPDVYGGRSVTAAGIAAHEVGHAIQHQEGYAPMALRQRMVPVANIGTSLGLWVAMAGIFVGITELAAVGVMLFGGAVAFTLVTLPVEFDASSRAKKALVGRGLVTGREAQGVERVLRAAAATYVAAAVSSILQLLYWAYRAGLLRR